MQNFQILKINLFNNLLDQPLPYIKPNKQYTLKRVQKRSKYEQLVFQAENKRRT